MLRSRPEKERRRRWWFRWKCIGSSSPILYTLLVDSTLRSMDGNRDSELATGACQPFRLSTREPARGQIHGFWMALWYEHLGLLDDVFLQPESLECVWEDDRITGKYWDLYSCDSVVDHDLPGHLLSYPIRVTDEGVVIQLPGMEFFLDTRACILGAKSDRLPPIFTI